MFKGTCKFLFTNERSHFDARIQIKRLLSFVIYLFEINLCSKKGLKNTWQFMIVQQNPLKIQSNEFKTLKWKNACTHFFPLWLGASFTQSYYVSSFYLYFRILLLYPQNSHLKSCLTHVMKQQVSLTYA